MGQMEKVASTYVYTIVCNTDSWREVALQHKKPNLALCDDLKEWDGGKRGRLKKEGIYVSLSLICVVAWQKPTQNCKN